MYYREGVAAAWLSNTYIIFSISLSLLASLLVHMYYMNVNCTLYMHDDSPRPVSSALLCLLVFLSLSLSFSVSFSALYFVAGRRQRWPTRVVEQSTWPQHISTQRMPAILS